MRKLARLFATAFSAEAPAESLPAFAESVRNCINERVAAAADTIETMSRRSSDAGPLEMRRTANPTHSKT